MRLCMALVAIIVLGATLASAQDYDGWIKSVDTLGSSIQFTCETPANPPDRDFVANASATRWLLPSYKFIDNNETQNHVTVSEDGQNLTISDIKREDLGVYFCLLRTPADELRMVKWGLNMKGPFFEDGWTKYQMNVIIGLSACGGFLLLSAVVFLVYRFRWRAPVEKNTTEMLPTSISSPGMTTATEVFATTAAADTAQSSSIEAKPYGTAVPPPYTVEAPVVNEKLTEKEVHAYSNVAASHDDGSSVNTTAL